MYWMLSLLLSLQFKCAMNTHTEKYFRPVYLWNALLRKSPASSSHFSCSPCFSLSTLCEVSQPVKCAVPLLLFISHFSSVLSSFSVFTLFYHLWFRVSLDNLNFRINAQIFVENGRGLTLSTESRNAYEIEDVSHDYIYHCFVNPIDAN